MSSVTKPRWHAMRTSESRLIETTLRPEFPNTDAYRYNSASIRVRVVDPRFAGLSTEKRDELIEPILKTLPDQIQDDIMNLLMLAPDEIEGFSRYSLVNLEFEDPSPSML